MNKEELKKILILQKEELKETKKQKLIEREILPVMKKFKKTKLIKVITGIRRCGKSIFSLELLEKEKFAYVNFDDEKLSRISIEDSNKIIETLHEIYGNFKFLFFDEIQNIEGWELFVNRLQRQGYNLVITGSNAKLLSKELATHLTGRYNEIQIYPFSFREFLNYKDFKISREDIYLPKRIGSIKKYLGDYLKTGGFPEVLKYKENKNYLTTLYNGIIGKDIVTRYNIKYSKTLKEIINYIISNCSKEISYNKLKNLFDVKSVHTIKNYISYVEESYLIFQLFPFSYKTKIQLISPKKIYAIDAGLVNAISPPMFDNKTRIIENVVFLELKRKQAINPGLDLYFWNGINSAVDFVVKDGLKVKQLIQVCYSLEDDDTRKREIKGLVKASEELKCRELLIISYDEEEEIKQDGFVIRVVPLWKWLLE
ncbi:MAG: ATP-binding protein [Candidatus Aenigmarchaeota archaeon]|nr:ATP-binding protein [Candidatus Aenigmarchaeota archaeon]